MRSSDWSSDVCSSDLVGGVVIGRDCFRVAIDHDGLVTILAQGERCVHAAVVELDALPDPVRAAAEHDDLVAVGRLGLALVLVGRVEIGGGGRERSEEPTSELQSLMRISYAVFCLKKKHKTTKHR